MRPVSFGVWMAVEERKVNRACLREDRCVPRRCAVLYKQNCHGSGKQELDPTLEQV